MEASYLCTSTKLLFTGDRLNDFAIPFRRGRVETGSKWCFIQHETHLHTLVIVYRTIRQIGCEGITYVKKRNYIEEEERIYKEKKDRGMKIKRNKMICKNSYLYQTGVHTYNMVTAISSKEYKTGLARKLGVEECSR